MKKKVFSLTLFCYFCLCGLKPFMLIFIFLLGFTHDYHKHLSIYEKWRSIWNVCFWINWRDIDVNWKVLLGLLENINHDHKCNLQRIQTCAIFFLRRQALNKRSLAGQETPSKSAPSKFLQAISPAPTFNTKLYIKRLTMTSWVERYQPQTWHSVDWGNFKN